MLLFQWPVLVIVFKVKDICLQSKRNLMCSSLMEKEKHTFDVSNDFL